MDQYKRVGWLVWIYYQDPIPSDHRGLTLGTSGFTVKVYVAEDGRSYQPHQGMNDDTITDDTHIAQTKGGPENNPNYSIQFFVSTKDYEETIQYFS